VSAWIRHPMPRIIGPLGPRRTALASAAIQLPKSIRPSPAPFSLRLPRAVKLHSGTFGATGEEFLANALVGQKYAAILARVAKVEQRRRQMRVVYAPDGYSAVLKGAVPVSILRVEEEN
jgi:hypothetical protein